MKSLENLKRYDVMLASASPRRRELLGMLGIDFSIAPALDIDESFPATLPSREVAEYIALRKAEAHRDMMTDRQLVITADTVVINDDMILGKPAGEADAYRMLRALSGHVHEVVTGVVVATKERSASFSALTKVEFSHLTDDEISDYIDDFHPMDKAGAYGIQEWIGCIGVSRIDGSFYNVMGLPLHRLYNALKTF